MTVTDEREIGSGPFGARIELSRTNPSSGQGEWFSFLDITVRPAVEVSENRSRFFDVHRAYARSKHFLFRSETRNRTKQSGPRYLELHTCRYESLDGLEVEGFSFLGVSEQRSTPRMSCESPVCSARLGPFH